MVQQYGFYIDVNNCASCKTCVAACKDKNDSYVGHKLRRVFECESGSWVEKEGVMSPDNIFVYSLSYSCNHCASPECVRVCPTGAHQKREDGITFVDTDVCIGCGTCASACPYDAPKLNTEKQYMGKCNFCMDRIDNGENPACVDACLMRCLHYGELSELQEKYGTIRDIEPLKSSEKTQPSIVIAPSRLSTGSGEIRVINPEAEVA
jgi:anaerobic dimethyl sulfoxide reductase subunit B (iron-sulfur subunit)